MYDGTGDYEVVLVQLGDTLSLAALEALGIPVGHIYGVPGTPGAALWGWFDDATLATGANRADLDQGRRNGLRRPALGQYGFDLGAVLTYCMFDETGTLNLFAVWSLWGDVNDDDAVCQRDLNIVIASIALEGIAVVLMNSIAADVVVDTTIDQHDQNLLTLFIALEGIPGVETVLGVRP